MHQIVLKIGHNTKTTMVCCHFLQSASLHVCWGAIQDWHYNTAMHVMCVAERCDMHITAIQKSKMDPFKYFASICCLFLLADVL